MRESATLPLRMLLTTNGSVTAMLEASFDTRVDVETRSKAVDHAHLLRTAVLRRESDGRPLLRATSDIASAEDVADLGVRPGTPVFERTYSIVNHAQRLATITERVPATLFEDAV